MKRNVLLVMFLFFGFGVSAHASSTEWGRYSLSLPIPITQRYVHAHANSVKTKPSVTPKTRGIMGEMAETTMDRFFQGRGKYTKIASQVGNTGIDGLYVRWTKSGNPKVLVAESKYHKSQLIAHGNKGPQMSHKWILESIDEKIADLMKQSRSPQNQKEIENLLKIRKVAERGVYTRRIFHSEIKQGRLVITLEDVKEYTDATGKVRTKPVPASDTTKGKAGLGWRVTSKGEQLEIPLSRREYDAAVKNISNGKRRYIDDQRYQFFRDFEETLMKNGLTKEEARELKKGIECGEIKNSRAINSAIDNKLFTGDRLKKTLRSFKFTPAEQQKILRLARTPVMGNPSIVKRVVVYCAQMKQIKQGVLNSLEALKNYKETGEKAIKTARKIDIQSVKENLKSAKTWQKVGRYSSRAVIVVAVATEVYRHGAFWRDFHRGLHTREEAYVFIGGSVGVLAGAKAGAWAGGKLGIALGGKLLGLQGAAVGGAVGSLVGGVCGAVIGYSVGEMLGDYTYSVFNQLEEEEYRRQYINLLKEYCNQKA